MIPDCQFNREFLEVAASASRLGCRLEVNDDNNRWYHRAVVVRIVGTTPPVADRELMAVSAHCPIVHAEFVHLMQTASDAYQATCWLIPGKEIGTSSFTGSHSSKFPPSGPEARAQKADLDSTYRSMDELHTAIHFKDWKDEVIAVLEELDGFQRCKVEWMDYLLSHSDDRIRNTLRRYKADDVITVLDDGRANFPANLKEGKAPIFGGARVG